VEATIKLLMREMAKLKCNITAVQRRLRLLQLFTRFDVGLTGTRAGFRVTELDYQAAPTPPLTTHKAIAEVRTVA
jgi:hypothetical protein